MEDGERRPWSPDAELTIEGAERLLAEQFPEVLRGVSKRVSEISSEPMSGATRPDLLPSGIPRPRIERLGSGWDNVAYLVGGRWVFRFPKREMGALCMRNEIASLPRIADALPLKVPRITHVGSPERARSVGSADAAYPYPFAGYELIEGRTACSVAWSEAERARCAEPLGRFLEALHGLAVPRDAPEDPAGDKDVAMLVEKTLTALARFEELVTGAEGGVRATRGSPASAAPEGTRAEIAALIRAARKRVLSLASTPNWNGEVRWVHGDLYARHMLVDERKRLCGVIDWGDVHAGETADDLSIAYAFLPKSARREFFEAYGEVDEASADRARLYALHSGAVVSAYGWEVGERVLVELGRATLEFAAE